MTGGSLPITMSRVIPPPQAVMTARMLTPKMSMSRFTPTSAPEIANAMVPSKSIKPMTEKIIPLPRG